MAKRPAFKKNSKKVYNALMFCPYCKQACALDILSTYVKTESKQKLSYEMMLTGDPLIAHLTVYIDNIIVAVIDSYGSVTNYFSEFYITEDKKIKDHFMNLLSLIEYSSTYCLQHNLTITKI